MPKSFLLITLSATKASNVGFCYSTFCERT